jgi:hypothetical protein
MSVAQGQFDFGDILNTPEAEAREICKDRGLKLKVYRRDNSIYEHDNGSEYEDGSDASDEDVCVHIANGVVVNGYTPNDYLDIHDEDTAEYGDVEEWKNDGHGDDDDGCR